MKDFKHEFDFKANEANFFNFYNKHNGIILTNTRKYETSIQNSDEFIEIIIKYPVDGQMTLVLDRRNHTAKGTIVGFNDETYRLMISLFNSLCFEREEDAEPISKLSIFLPEVHKRVEDEDFIRFAPADAVVANNYHEAYVYVYLHRHKRHMEDIENRTYPLFLYASEEETFGYGDYDLMSVDDSIEYLEEKIEELKKLRNILKDKS